MGNSMALHPQMQPQNIIARRITTVSDFDNRGNDFASTTNSRMGMTNQHLQLGRDLAGTEEDGISHAIQDEEEENEL